VQGLILACREPHVKHHSQMFHVKQASPHIAGVRAHSKAPGHHQTRIGGQSPPTWQGHWRGADSGGAAHHSTICGLRRSGPGADHRSRGSNAGQVGERSSKWSLMGPADIRQKHGRFGWPNHFQDGDRLGGAPARWQVCASNSVTNTGRPDWYTTLYIGRMPTQCVSRRRVSYCGGGSLPPVQRRIALTDPATWIEDPHRAPGFLGQRAMEPRPHQLIPAQTDAGASFPEARSEALAAAFSRTMAVLLPAGSSSDP
jgi:hypothetical protein